MKLEDLPPELIQKIAEYLPYSDQLSFALTNKKNNAIMQDALAKRRNDIKAKVLITNGSMTSTQVEHFLRHRPQMTIEKFIQENIGYFQRNPRQPCLQAMAMHRLVSDGDTNPPAAWLDIMDQQARFRGLSHYHPTITVTLLAMKSIWNLYIKPLSIILVHYVNHQKSHDTPLEFYCDNFRHLHFIAMLILASYTLLGLIYAAFDPNPRRDFHQLLESSFDQPTLADREYIDAIKKIYDLTSRYSQQTFLQILSLPALPMALIVNTALIVEIGSGAIPAALAGGIFYESGRISRSALALGLCLFAQQLINQQLTLTELAEDNVSGCALQRIQLTASSGIAAALSLIAVTALSKIDVVQVKDALVVGAQNLGSNLSSGVTRTVCYLHRAFCRPAPVQEVDLEAGIKRRLD